MASVPFNNLITFSRGSNATLTGPDGLVQWAPNNLLTFSEQFDNSNWPKADVTIVTNNAVAPDGTTTAELMYPTTTGSTRRILRGTSLTTSVIYAQSIYVKAAGKRWVYLNGVDATSAANDCWFDLQNVVVGTKGASVLSAGITAVGNGWYRIFATGAAAANNYFYLMAVDGDNSLISTTNGTDGIYIWGAQLELGSAATTYNSTTVKNLLGFSEAFDNAAWLKLDASIVTGAQANPVNGAFNAQKLMENTANAAHYVYRDLTVASGTPYVLSTYAKKAGNDFIRLFITQESAGAWFNLNTGTVGTILGTGITASITSVGDGWYRCSITKTATGTSWRVNTYMSKLDNSTSYTGDGNSGVYIYGAQLSDSASLDPYVPTPAAAPSSTPYYGPRFDYDPVTLAPKGLLVEEARTNLFTYSEQFDNAAWTKTNATVTANTTVAPDGATTADKMVETSAATTRHGINQSYLAAAGSFTISVFAKAAENGFLVIAAGGAGQPNAFTWFNLNTGAIGTNNNTAATIQALGNGWYRCSITFTAIIGVLTPLIEMSKANGVNNYTGDGTSGIFIWGAQLEAGAFATSYIPTVASTVTRAADIATINGSLFSQWFSNTQGSFVVQADVVGSFGNYPYMLSLSGQQGMFIQPTNILGVGRIFSNDAVTANSTSLNTAFKAAGGYSPTNPALAVLNGGTVGTGTEVWSAAADQLRLGANVISSRFLNGHIRSIDYIPARAADFQLQALTELPLVPTLDLDFLNNLYEA